uniref:Acetate succinate CoA-transferase 2 n=1 Tax=Stygiella incarcerata TaxID=1712417 RepID=A0A192ZIJ1_9EUKA|nr:acetate succinate CoA-transferase 2 [Stygiella incarcerata]ANM86877.1 acetate succinate CoA-transferase 2 [Stygiella incarcerata]
MLTLSVCAVSAPFFSTLRRTVLLFGSRTFMEQTQIHKPFTMGGKRPKYSTADEAVKSIKSGDQVFIHTAVAAPQHLIRAMTARASELKGVVPVHIHTEPGTVSAGAPYADPVYEDIFRSKCLFIGSNHRQAVNDKRADFVPCFLGEVPEFFRKGKIPLDVAMITVSPPDKHGWCSLGTSVDVSLAAVESAKYVIAQVNSYMPRTHGAGIIHVSHIDELVEHHSPLPEIGSPHVPHHIESVGKHIADLIPDGACLQMGVGAIPDATLRHLGNHRNLGIHTEMFSNGLVPLLEKGVITNHNKHILPGKCAVSFVMGYGDFYKYLNDNPLFFFAEVSIINNPRMIKWNKLMHSINSCIEIDLTGQVCSDSMGLKMYSGVGGQVDFVRGASLSEGGKAIIALPSVTSKRHGNHSRIVPTLKTGSGVVTSRAHVHYVATEYGVVNLFGKSIRERAELLISIAHPMHRETLEKAARERFGPSFRTFY